MSFPAAALWAITWSLYWTAVDLIERTRTPVVLPDWGM